MYGGSTRYLLGDYVCVIQEHSDLLVNIRRRIPRGIVKNLLTVLLARARPSLARAGPVNYNQFNFSHALDCQ